MVTTSKKGAGRRTTKAAVAEETGLPERRGRKPSGGGLPRRALADGVVERRRTRPRDDAAAPSGAFSAPSLGRPSHSGEDHLPPRLTAEEHYRLERRRRADRLTGDLMTLLAEAKAEYEAQINAPRPAGKGGRPRKKAAVVVDDDDL